MGGGFLTDLWENIIFFNALLSKANEEAKKEAIQLYFQHLWQMDNLVIILGAGFSKALGGPLMSDLSKEILPKVIIEGWKNTETQNISEWINLWEIEEDLKVNIQRCLENGNDEIVHLKDHCKTLNIEEKISQLQTILLTYKIWEKSSSVFENALLEIKKGIVERIDNFIPSISNSDFSTFLKDLEPYRGFLKRLIKYRRPQQPRVKFFTTNYDLIVELACDLEGINCITGFDGKTIKILNPTNFDLEITFKTSGQSNVYYSNVIHLYKLHGSIDWMKMEILGIDEIVQNDNKNYDKVVIYPCYTKFAETLEMPYYEMFRRLGDAVSQPQTTVLTIGYGFNDEHVNQMILRAYKNPSCQLLICEPSVKKDTDEEKSTFLKSLKKMCLSEKEEIKSDPRVTILAGDSAKFPNILNILFPPLELENPTEQVKRLVQQLIEKIGEKN